MLADTFAPRGSAHERASFAAFQRNSARAEMAADLLELTFATDVASAGRRARADARRPSQARPRNRHRRGEQLAALVPNAELVVLERRAPAVAGDSDDRLAAIAYGVPVSGAPAKIITNCRPDAIFGALQVHFRPAQMVHFSDVGCTNPVSRRMAVFMDQSAQPIATRDVSWSDQAGEQ
jgi:hypothetical protein